MLLLKKASRRHHHALPNLSSVPLLVCPGASFGYLAPGINYIQGQTERYPGNIDSCIRWRWQKQRGLELYSLYGNGSHPRITIRRNRNSMRDEYTSQIYVTVTNLCVASSSISDLDRFHRDTQYRGLILSLHLK